MLPAWGFVGCAAGPAQSLPSSAIAVAGLADTLPTDQGGWALGQHYAPLLHVPGSSPL